MTSTLNIGKLIPRKRPQLEVQYKSTPLLLSSCGQSRRALSQLHVRRALFVLSVAQKWHCEVSLQRDPSVPHHHLGTRTLQKGKLCGRGRKESRKGERGTFVLAGREETESFFFWRGRGISWTGFSLAPNWVTDAGGVSREEKKLICSAINLRGGPMHSSLATLLLFFPFVLKGRKANDNWAVKVRPRLREPFFRPC